MAILACMLWLVGFELMPWMHVALHDQLGAHHHDASGAIIRDDVALGAHHHHHGGELEVDAPPTGAAHTDAHARIANALGHGQHSLAHHGVALNAPAPIITRPLPVDRHVTIVVAIASPDPITPLCARPKARDPPASTI